MSAPSAADVRRVIADVLGVDPDALGVDPSPETVASWDSVHHLSLILALEQEFAVRLAPEEIEEAVSLGAIVELLRRKRS